MPEHKLIQFVRIKKAYIDKKFKFKFYLVEEDIKDLKQYPKEKLDKVFEKIKIVINDYGVSGFSKHCCPFCILHSKSCNNCEYGKRHGQCGMSGSIVDLLISNFNTDKIITNRVYKNMLKKVNGG